MLYISLIDATASIGPDLKVSGTPWLVSMLEVEIEKSRPAESHAPALNYLSNILTDAGFLVQADNEDVQPTDIPEDAT